MDQPPPPRRARLSDEDAFEIAVSDSLEDFCSPHAGESDSVRNSNELRLNPGDATRMNIRDC